VTGWMVGHRRRAQGWARERPERPIRVEVLGDRGRRRWHLVASIDAWGPVAQGRPQLGDDLGRTRAEDAVSGLGHVGDD
jgi:hypothetical protein